VPINQNKCDQCNNNHDGGGCEPSKGKAVPPTARSSIAPATRWNVAGLIHLSVKRAFDAEQVSRALVFEACS
jgi:hypothetical protein